MSEIRYVLFDLDGTLIDSRDSIVASGLATAERFSPGRFTSEQLIARFGEPFPNFIEELGINKEDGEEVLSYFLQHNAAYHDQLVKPFPMVLPCLYELREAGYILGVVTNKDRQAALKGLNQWRMASLMDVIVTINDVERGKPDPEPIQQALMALNANPSEAIMVGDSIYDMLASDAARTISVLIEWYTDAKKVEFAPDYRIFNLQQLPELLSKINQIKLQVR